MGDRNVENIGPFKPGIETSQSGARELPLDKEAVTGFSIIEAEGFEEARAMAQSCPFITAIRVYELMTM